MEVASARKFQHRQLMIRISQRLSDSDLSDLKYLCGDIVPESALGSVKFPTDLFTLLQYHGYLGPGTYSFVKKGLSAIGRDDLASMLPELEEGVSQCSGEGSSLLPKSECELKHRMMLLAIADRMRKDDILKLMYVSTGKVKGSSNDTKVTDDAIGALQVLAGLDESNFLCCSSYSVLCDLLQQIGRRDLADIVVGFPGSVPQGFTVKGQALGLMMEVLRNKKNLYLTHQEKLGRMRDGDSEIVQQIHLMLLRECTKCLGTRKAPTCTASTIRSLQSAFKSQHKFLQVVSEIKCQQIKHRKKFKFADAFGSKHKVLESDICPVADSAHQARRFILEVSCELIGREKATKVHQFNDEIEHGINICSGYGKHISSLLHHLTSLLSSVSKKEINIEHYKKELTEIFTNHQNYMIGSFPLLASYTQSENIEDLTKISLGELVKLIALPSTLNFFGLVAMVTIPSYAILLNLFASLGGQDIDSDQVLGELVDYVHHASHLLGSKEFIQRCALSLHEQVSCFKQNIIELDDLCAPLIKELVSY